MTDVSGVTMPASAPSGWSRVWDCNFGQGSVARGSFPGLYANKFWVANEGELDTSKHGVYSNARTTRVHDDQLKIKLFTDPDDGDCCVARLQPRHPYDMLGGRFTIRMKVDHNGVSGANFKMVPILLWPDSNKWTEGEIDFPECDIAGNPGSAYGWLHWRNAPASQSGVGPVSNVVTVPGTWATYTIEWKTDSVKFFKDGTQIGTTITAADKIPNTEMHWMLQLETAIGQANPPASNAEAYFYADWMTVDRPA